MEKLPYAKFARSLLRVSRDPPQADIARRYLSLHRRGRVLHRGICQAQDLAAQDNPLSDIGFTAPLCVAGCDQPMSQKAAAMIRQGLPVATEKDDRGHHRGTAIGDVIDGLFAQTGQCYSDSAVLDLYVAWMSGHPNVLHRHPQSRFRKIPRLLARLKSETATAKADLRTAILSLSDDLIFRVSVNGPLLAAKLIGVTGGVVFGFAGRQLRIAGSDVAVLRGKGRGLACLNVKDLRRLCVGADVVRIECGLFEWIGTGRGQRRRYEYYAVDVV